MRSIKSCGLIGSLLLVSCQGNIHEPEASGFQLSDSMWAMTKLSEVEWRPQVESYQFFGKVTAAQGKVAPVYTMTGGSVKQLKVEQGDYVRKGQVLALIHSPDVAELERRQTEAQNALREAQKRLSMVEDMHASHLASSRDLVIAGHEVENSEAALNQIRQVLNVYNQARDGIYPVTSPMDGYIMDLKTTEGMQLPTDHADPLFVVAEMDPVWVLAQVPESELSKVEEGLPVWVRTHAEPDRVFEGQIERIYPIIDDRTRAATIRIPLENPDLALKPNMSVRVSVQKESEKRVATLPRNALIFDRNDHWVVVYKDRSDMEIRKVRPISETDAWVQVDRGVEEGEVVVSQNQLLIYEAINLTP